MLVTSVRRRETHYENREVPMYCFSTRTLGIARRGHMGLPCQRVCSNAVYNYGSAPLFFREKIRFDVCVCGFGRTGIRQLLRGSTIIPPAIDGDTTLGGTPHRHLRIPPLFLGIVSATGSNFSRPGYSIFPRDVRL